MVRPDNKQAADLVADDTATLEGAGCQLGAAGMGMVKKTILRVVYKASPKVTKGLYSIDTGL